MKGSVCPTLRHVSLKCFTDQDHFFFHFILSPLCSYILLWVGGVYVVGGYVGNN